MNRKPISERVKIIQLLCEGNSVRGTARLTNSSINTVLKLIVEVGTACQKYHDTYVRELPCTKIQVDEMWSFVGKRRNREGDSWLWISMCPDSKLVTNWHIGDRKAEDAKAFIADLAPRLKNKVHLVSDGYGKYVDAVEGAFGPNVKYSMLVKQYSELENRKRYKGALRQNKIGAAPINEISTSYIERQNLTVRMGCRRMARKTNAHSKKIENHKCALALHFCFYNFARIHGSLRVTPAMEAGLCDHVWSIEEILALTDQKFPEKPKPKTRTEGKHLSAAHFRWDGRGRKS